MYSGARTITEAVLPRASIWRDALLVLGGSVLTGLAAQISIPLYSEGVVHPIAATIATFYAALGVPLPATPVPITGQTFAVLLVGALLGGRLGFLSLMAYLGEGLMGMPVFSLGRNAWNLSGGVPLIFGPTAGYLLSYPFAAYAVGWLAERGWDRRTWSATLAMLAGSSIIYLVGLTWLSRFVGIDNVLSMGLVPFIPDDLLKLLLAASLLPSGWLVLRRWGLR